MSQFNSLERAAAKVLSNMPRLKSFIKGSYQSLNYALNHKDYKYKLAEGLSLKKWAIQDRGSFGGYYDKDHTTTFILPVPSHGESKGLEWDGQLTLYTKCQDTH